MSEHLYPATVADMALAPVLIGIERNLARLRDNADLEFALALELNDDQSFYHSPHERADRLRRCAIRNLDLHGWSVSPTSDLFGLAVSHGAFTVSVMLGRQLTGYVLTGQPEAPAGQHR